MQFFFNIHIKYTILKKLDTFRFSCYSFQRLGTLIKLKDADPQNVFLGGLDSNGNDGKFAYIWQDDVTQVVNVLYYTFVSSPIMQSEWNCQQNICNKLQFMTGSYILAFIIINGGWACSMHYKEEKCIQKFGLKT